MAAVPLTGLTLVVLFLLLVAVKRPKQRSDLFLAFFFVLIGAELFYRYSRYSTPSSFPEWLVGLDLVYWILLGPALLLYTRFVIRKDKPLHPAMALHLIPLAIVLVPYIRFLTTDTGYSSFFAFTNASPVYRWVIDIFWEFAVSVYLVITIITILQHHRTLPRFFSSRRQKELNWLLYLAGGFLAYILISLALGYLSSFGILPRMLFLGILSVFVLLLFLLGVGVFGYRQKGIFSTDALEEISNLQFQGNLPAHPEREFKYRKSGLQDDESDRILQSLKRLIKTDKFYLDPELTLQDLASRLSTTIHKLSQVINEQFGQNFYDYINTYRIEEVKKRLQDSRYNHLKVIAIAYDCGFNSKSAFYTAFRKATSVTPVEYRNKYQPEHGAVFSN